MRYALLYFGREDNAAALSYGPPPSAARGDLMMELLPSTTAMSLRPAAGGHAVLDGPLHAGPLDLMSVHVVSCADLAGALEQAQARGGLARVCEIRPLEPTASAAPRRAATDD